MTVERKVLTTVKSSMWQQKNVVHCAPHFLSLQYQYLLNTTPHVNENG